MKKTFAAMLALLCCTTSAFGQTAPNPADDAQIDKLMTPFIDSLIAGRTKEAVTTLLNRSELMRAKPTETDFLGNQAEAAITIYGRTHACELVERQSKGPWDQIRMYVCQQDKFLMRWIVVLFKSPNGWQPASVSFDDKFNLGLDK